ncbi:high-affinity nickel-transporter [Chthoniobacter flavus Ellin428]|uniref:Nickel/cobalt efflux system n=1 Tax=Chthoniobacter flavus Ellin428 TaxID=497964 RepID=B4D826_9BACT|nr:sulfite exporter TauE/SafE family protein [Chthoniobacter flavus]EDY17380.1 high-affinity nickel-transporter [Chthoniobacter flavus Ellin428]TCO87371.1 high-affinity nickel-transport protein [Chthoniobacter flavus]
MTISFYSILVLGFFLGMRHATDADHVVAITNIVSQQRSIRSAAWTGVLWGIGHSLTVFVVGAAIACFGFVVSKRIGLSLELSVGIMLIVLGWLNLHAAFRWPGKAGGEEQTDAAEAARLDRWLRFFSTGSPFRPLVIGIVHGLAGSAAVALLVLPLMRDTFGAITYLLIFGAGTVAGMMIVTAAIAAPIRYAAEHSAHWHRVLGGLAGATSFGLGAFLVYQIGFVQKLFLANL